jgi:hypothetical protein
LYSRDLHERQAAQELEEWKAHIEEREVIDTSEAAIRRALLLTDEELDSLEKRAGDGDIAKACSSFGRGTRTTARDHCRRKPPGR